MQNNPNNTTHSAPVPDPSRGPQARLPLSWWTLVFVVAAGLILGIGGLEIVRFLARPVALLILAISIASALIPLVDWLDGKRLPRTLAVILIYVLLVLLIAGIFGATVPLLVAQVRSLIKESSIMLPKIYNWLDQFGFDPQGLSSTIMSEAGQYGVAFLRLPVRLISGLVDFVLVLFLSLYWIILSPGIKKFFLSFFPTERKQFMSEMVVQMGTQMGGYIRGSAINGLIIGVLTYIGLSIIGVPYTLTIAALAGLMEFFPVIGPIVSGGTATLVALSVSPNLALITLIFAIVLQQTEGHILVPLIMRAQASISPLLAVFAIVSGASIGGLLGAVIAIPIASVLDVLIHWVIAPAIRRANGVEAENV